MRQKILLHACCGPCSTTAIERLYPEYEVLLYFYNPNIAPQAEYLHRQEEARRLVGLLPADWHVSFLEGPYHPALFYERVQGLENEPEGGARCAVCFAMRLEQTAQTALETGCDCFATTLTVSPHKEAALINRIGQEVAQSRPGVTYVPSNFKKQDGYKRSIELSKTYQLYRQSFCGCCFSNPAHQTSQL